MDEWQSRPHRRYNPLTGEWVLVSPHRTERPWQGERVALPAEQSPRYDPSCYLCPGNTRADGRRNPQYEGVFAFENDFTALLPETPEQRYERDGLLLAQSERGTCRVLCFSPRHDAAISSMPPDAVRGVIDAWAAQYVELAALPFVHAVTIFENHGGAMGASNPHPHGQIWANASIPNEPAKEGAALRRHRERRGECLLCAYGEWERRDGTRVVYADAHVVAVVPFWAVWPFELLLLGRRHCGSLDAFDDGERDALARALSEVTRRYDRLFAAPFPYSMGIHQRPCDGERHDEWHAHAHYFPPLLRSATVRKYMVGYEMLAQPQRDLTPEQAAQRLRDA